LREKYRLRVFENRVVRRIFRPQKKEVGGDGRTLNKEQPYFCSLVITGVIKLRRMRQAEL
jgi:hypothetical protein